MYCTNGCGKNKYFMGYKIFLPGHINNLGEKKDWQKLNMFSTLDKKEMGLVKKILRNWTLYENGWFIGSFESIYDVLFRWITQLSRKRPQELDIIYKRYYNIKNK